MKKTVYISFYLLFLIFLASCTSGRWVVKDEEAVDRSDYEVLKQQKFLAVADSLSPQNPVFKLNVMSHTTYRYKQKMLVQRNIQDYRLRPGFVALGLAGAAAAFYAANSGRFDGSSAQSLTLNGVGILLAASGFINLKPVGEPRPIGEERYLENTGTVVETDTVNIRDDEISPATVLVTHRGATVFEEELEQISGGQLQMPLGQSFNDLNLTGGDSGNFEIAVTFQDSTYRYKYPVSSILEPYAQITTDLTELRSKPEIEPENVLADLTRGSEIRIDTILNDQWYRVWYGIAENYIQRKDAQIVWRATNFSGNNTNIVAVPRIPFGNVDVESNIPALRERNINAQALIITNENYSEPLSERRDTHRDGQLMEIYLKEALGYATENIHQLTDIREPEQIYQQIEEIAEAANDSTELFVYMAGYGTIDNRRELYLKNLATEEGTSLEDASIRSILDQIASLSLGNTWVVADIDFSPSMSDSISKEERRALIRSHTSGLTESPNTVFVTGSQLGQPSRLYRSSTGEDKNHHIFPYFFAQALKERRASMTEIYSLLQQNISYTSRRLHDRPQEPIIFGDRLLSFTDP